MLHLRVPIGWNPAKRAENIIKHGVDFADIERFEWGGAFVRADTRHDYGEVRLRAVGLIDGRAYVLVFTIRRTTIWAISFRKANNKEIGHFEDQA